MTNIICPRQEIILAADTKDPLIYLPPRLEETIKMHCIDLTSYKGEHFSEHLFSTTKECLGDPFTSKELILISVSRVREALVYLHGLRRSDLTHKYTPAMLYANPNDLSKNALGFSLDQRILVRLNMHLYSKTCTKLHELPNIILNLILPKDSNGTRTTGSPKLYDFRDTQAQQ